MIKVPLGRPTSIQIRHEKMVFFLGDRWVEIGPVRYGPAIVRNTGRLMDVPVKLPDVEEFFAGRQHLDDGTNEWRMWGPRVN